LQSDIFFHIFATEISNSKLFKTKKSNKMAKQKAKKKTESKPKKTGLFGLGLGAKKETVKKEAVKKPEVKPEVKANPVVEAKATEQILGTTDNFPTEAAKPEVKVEKKKEVATKKPKAAKPAAEKPAKVEVVKINTTEEKPKQIVVPQAMEAAIKAAPDKAALLTKAIKAGQITDINTLKIACNTIIGYGKYDILQVGKSGQSRIVKVVIKAGGEVDQIKIS